MARKKTNKAQEFMKDAVVTDTAVTGTTVKDIKEAAAEKITETVEKITETVKATKEKAAAKAPKAPKAPKEPKEPKEPKTTAKTTRTASKSAKENCFIEFDGKQINISDIMAQAKSLYSGEIKTVSAYVKPEDSKVYYVINDVEHGAFDI